MSMSGQTFSNNTKISTACFLEDIDRVQKLRENALHGSLCFPSAHLFNGNWKLEQWELDIEEKFRNARAKVSPPWKYVLMGSTTNKSPVKSQINLTTWFLKTSYDFVGKNAVNECCIRSENVLGVTPNISWTPTPFYWCLEKYQASWILRFEIVWRSNRQQ